MSRMRLGRRSPCLPQDGIFSHILSLSEDLLGTLGIRQGPMSLFEWERKNGKNGDLSYRAGADYRLRFADLSFTGTPLYPTQADSFPPFAALCLHGGEAIVRPIAVVEGRTALPFRLVAPRQFDAVNAPVIPVLGAIGRLWGKPPSRETRARPD